MDIIIALPKDLYVMRTKPHQDIVRDAEEYNIYFRNIILPYREEWDIKVECDYGNNYGEFWRITEFPYDRVEFPLTIAIYDEWGQRICEKSCTVHLVDKKMHEEYCVMPIGDSMTHTTICIEHAVNKLYNVTTRGLRSFNGHTHTEGRGGWTYNSYFTQNTICWGGVSPFLFPVGVEGKDYYGDLNFEEMKQKENGLTYSYDGFPVYELKEGMIYHKDGKLYKREADAEVLVDESPKWEASFIKYMERYNPGHIDAVSILMGGNDLQNVPYEKSDEAVALYVENTARMIEIIREYDPNIRFIINLPIIGAEQYAWGKRLGCVSGSKQYRFHVIKAAQTLIDRYDDEEGIHIAATLLNLDPVHGFDKEPYRANKYCDDYVMKQSNWVHPNANGYKQMGDAIAAVIEAVRG